jgi:DNA modification methylase
MPVKILGHTMLEMTKEHFPLQTADVQEAHNALSLPDDKNRVATNSDTLIDSMALAEKNFLFYGDTLEVMRKHIKDETVDLCYIDPPFNSQRNYNQIYNNIGTEDAAQAQAFTDTWVWDDIAIAGYDEIRDNAHGRFTAKTVELIKGFRSVIGEGSLLAYVISVTLRVTEIQRILKPTGSFYFHCDPTASHYIKLVLDGIFCSVGGEYVNEITWKRTTAHSDAKQGRKAYGNVADIIFFYTKSGDYTFNPQHSDYSEKYLKKYSGVDSDGRRYRLDNLTGPGGAAKGNPMYEVMVSPAIGDTAKRKCRSLSKRVASSKRRTAAFPSTSATWTKCRVFQCRTFGMIFSP